jgi:peroxiredoxin
VDPYDPEAIRELQHCASVYKKLESYSDRGTMQLSAKINGKVKSNVSRLEFAFQRPNKIRLCTDQACLISDGQKLIAAVHLTHKYAEDKALPELKPEELIKHPVGPAFLGGTGGVVPVVLLTLLTSDDPVREIKKDTIGLKIQSRDDKQTCLLVDQTQGPDILLYFNKQTGLLDRLSMAAADPEQFFGWIPANEGVREVELTWAAGRVQAGNVSSEVFRCQVPDGYKKVEHFAQTYALPEGKETLVDKEAKDFTLPTRGPTSEIKKANLAGKVAILLFWMSWSSPSLDQLRDALAVVKAYHDKDVALLAINMDDAPVERSKIESKLTNLFKEKEIDFPQSPTTILAFDPKNSVGQAYEVQAVPTTIVLDRQGIVRFHVVGHLKDSQNVLDRQVKKLVSRGPSPGR